MNCLRCRKPLRSSDGVKCDGCESRFHLKCVASPKDFEGGDRGYRWRCAVCRQPAGKGSSHSRVLLKSINQLSEKFELVNKIQLPKLNNDLLLLKSTADRIVKQNEDILTKIDQLRKVEEPKTTLEPSQKRAFPRCRRRRPLVLTRAKAPQDNEGVPMVPASEKCASYKTRRRSYHLHKVLLLMNRKLLRKKSRNKSPH